MNSNLKRRESSLLMFEEFVDYNSLISNEPNDLKIIPFSQQRIVIEESGTSEEDD